MRSALFALATCAWLVTTSAAAQPCGPPPVTFTNLLIADDYTYAYGIAVADLDQDGDPDVTSADTTSDVLYWYENDGAGSLTRHVIKQNDPGWFERHVAVDMNQDGFPDVVVVKIAANSIVWYQNDGTPQDGGWTEWAIAPGTMPYAYDVDVADLDGDGDLDVAASSYVGNDFSWFENPGDPTVEDWTRRLVSRGEITLTMHIGDFNLDGRPDLLASALETGLFWYENTGAPATVGWIEHRLMRRGRPSHGQPVDLDGDGDLDIVLARGGAVSTRGDVVWFENRGQSHFARRRIQRGLPQAFEAVAGDMDGDGDVDVVASVWGYPGGLLNGDGRLDILSTAERNTNQLRWWRNDGP